ncbi:MAG TPA: methyltransferase [Clostridiales bacterium]|nr:MAG: hypothetical protein A2Y18_02045 [Clostridiales bacterium GWD2_32_19]HCC07487.1 methyltransferase [Clostridiales bacterium]
MIALTTWEFVRRIIFAILLGGLIGLEREKGNRPAGIRTYALVTTGSCLAMLIGIYTATGINVDPTRIGAQVISGIGFLGAGTIMRYGNNIVGLTTAAGLWVMACIGLAIGAGMYEIAIITTLLIFAILIYIPYIERLFFGKRILFHVSIQISEETNSMEIITQIIKDHDLDIKSIDINLDKRKNKIITLSLQANSEIVKIEFLEKIKDIVSIESVE